MSGRVVSALGKLEPMASVACIPVQVQHECECCKWLVKLIKFCRCISEVIFKIHHIKGTKIKIKVYENQQNSVWD